MSSTAFPFGMEPIFHPSGQVRNQVLINGITSGYTSNIGYLSPVRLDPTTRKLVIAPNTGDIYGVFGGVEYKQSASSTLVTTSKNWIANTTYVGDMKVFIWRDPAIIYKIQANGSLAEATALGNQANLVNPGNVSSLGNSQAAISTSLAGTGVQAQLRIVDIANAPDNVWGDAFTVVEVEIAQQQYIANKVAV